MKIMIFIFYLFFYEILFLQKNNNIIFIDDGATMMEVDHETRKVYVEHMKLIGDDNIQLMEPSEEGVIARLTNPIVTTYIDTDKISFER